MLGRWFIREQILGRYESMDTGYSEEKAVISSAMREAESIRKGDYASRRKEEAAIVTLRSGDTGNKVYLISRQWMDQWRSFRKTLSLIGTHRAPDPRKHDKLLIK